jgi:ABC-type multidrug transport system fused ATPase/permease subunit
MSTNSRRVSSHAGMVPFIRQLARPYRGSLIVILIAMLVETAMGLAGPWPFKVVIDYAIGTQPAPRWLALLVSPGIVDYPTELATAAALAIVVIALVGGVASYVDNYYTESVGQCVANDLRMRVFEHLQRLSFDYYDTHQTGLLLSTMIDDVSTVETFVSSSTLSIPVDLTTILGMLGLMFWLNWTSP